MNNDMHNAHDAIFITYEGEKAKAEAAVIHARIQAARVMIGEAVEAPQARPNLGAEEIILTLVTSAAAKTAIALALQQLKHYLVERIEKQEEDLNIQAVIKKPTARFGTRIPFSLRKASVETVTEFVEKVAETALDTLD